VDLAQRIIQYKKKISKQYLVPQDAFTNDTENDCDEDGDKIIKKEPRSQIKEIGNKIYQRGGMTALRANYYTMVNFMTINREVKAVESYWDGVGEWQS
jgi:uncharacterized protein YycO